MPGHMRRRDHMSPCMLQQRLRANWKHLKVAMAALTEVSTCICLHATAPRLRYAHVWVSIASAMCVTNTRSGLRGRRGVKRSRKPRQAHNCDVSDPSSHKQILALEDKGTTPKPMLLHINYVLQMRKHTAHFEAAKDVLIAYFPRTWPGHLYVLE